MLKVYVSSTYKDLQEHRREVELVLRRMGCLDVAMEYYGAEDRRPVDKCLEDVKACDVYLGIFGWRYGYVPDENNPDRRSITEMEYRQALDKKTCLIFLEGNKEIWPTEYIDRDATQIDNLRQQNIDWWLPWSELLSRKRNGKRRGFS